MLNSWRNPGDITNYQKVNSQRQFSSKDIQDASFVRFRNLQAGYTFTANPGSRFRSFKLWGQAQNLYTWTKWQGFDPEESNNIATYEFPNPRTYTIGLDLNF
jgi:TonB-dependent starch-binding outer membrane protein SusC